MGFDMIWPWISWWFFPWDSMGFGQKHMAENRDSTCINWGLIYWYMIDIWIIMDDYGSCIYIYTYISYIYIYCKWGSSTVANTSSTWSAQLFLHCQLRFGLDAFGCFWLDGLVHWATPSLCSPLWLETHERYPHRPPLSSPEPRVWQAASMVPGPPVIAGLLVLWEWKESIDRVIVVVIISYWFENHNTHTHIYMYVYLLILSYSDFWFLNMILYFSK